MKHSDDRWMARAMSLAPSLWRHAYPVRTRRNWYAFRLYSALLRVHRAAWVRGIEL